ncbi:MAG: hypothetical protein ABFR75_11165 [Acidobacteriota bacterium]
MKKTIFSLSILLFLLFFTGCKKPVIDFEWYMFEGEGSYSADTNKSYFKLDCRIKLNQSSININPSSPGSTWDFQFASINFWECLITDGESAVLLFNGETISEKMEDIYTNVSEEEQPEYLWVFAESKILVDNDIYRGYNPQKIILRVYIKDSEGNIETLEKETDFIFTRK